MDRRAAVLMGILLGFTTHADAGDGGRVRVGIQAANGWEREIFGSGKSSGTSIVFFQPQLGVALHQSHGKPRLEFVTEGTLAESVHPSKRFILSMNIGLRWHIPVTDKFGVYTEMGAGPGSSALHSDPTRPADGQYRQLSGWLQYHLQLGAGVRIRAGSGAVQVGYRLTHFSNNDTTKRNFGLNLDTVTVSYQFSPF